MANPYMYGINRQQYTTHGQSPGALGGRIGTNNTGSGPGGINPGVPAAAESSFNYKQAGAASAGAAFALFSGMQGIGQHKIDAETNNTSLAMQRLELYKNLGQAIGMNTNEAANSAFGVGAAQDLNTSLIGQAEVQSAHLTSLQRINDLIAKANERSQKIAAIIGAVNSAAASFAGGG